MVCHDSTSTTKTALREKLKGVLQGQCSRDLKLLARSPGKSPKAPTPPPVHHQANSDIVGMYVSTRPLPPSSGCC